MTPTQAIEAVSAVLYEDEESVRDITDALGFTEPLPYIEPEPFLNEKREWFVKEVTMEVFIVIIVLLAACWYFWICSI